MPQPNKNLSKLKTTREILGFFKDNSSTHEDLGLTKATLDKYNKIKEAEYLYSEDVQEILPSTISSLYQLSILGQKLFVKALEEGIVTPSVTSRKIQVWRQSLRKTRKKHKLVTYVFYLPSDLDEAEIEDNIREMVCRIGKPVKFRKGESRGKEIIRDVKLTKLNEARMMSTSTKDDIYALDCGHRAVHSDTKQKRYVARCRLAKLAEQGNHIASFLVSNL